MKRLRAALMVALVLTISDLAGSDLASHPRLPDDERDVAQAASEDLSAKRYDAAAAKYQSIIDKYPDCLYAWSNLGVTRSNQGHWSEAEKAFATALKLQPRDEFVLLDLGLVYLPMNRPDEAVEKLRQAVALKPDDAFAHNALGSAYEKFGRKKEAEEEFRKARQINQTSGQPFPAGTY